MIREIKRDEIPICVDIIRRSFKTVADEFGFTAENAPGFTAFSTCEERLYWQMDNEPRLMFVNEQNSVICGYYSLLMQDNNECELNNLAVLPEYRHGGIGKKLLKHAFETADTHGCKRVNIGIVEENKRLRNWYEQNGFTHTGTKKFDFFPFTCGYMVKELLSAASKNNDPICIKLAETDEELCGRGYVHCTSWQEAYRGIVSDRYLDTMTVDATTARARQFPQNTLIAKDKDKVVGFAVYGPSRDEDLINAGEVVAIYVLSEYYDQKIGYRLMNEAFSRLSKYNTVFLWVFEKNERAKNFYHRYGFEFDGCKKQWNLGTPVSIVRMIKKRNV